MRLQALRENPHETPGAFQFAGYQLQLGERKMKSEEKQPIPLPVSVTIDGDANEIIKKIFSNLK